MIDMNNKQAQANKRQDHDLAFLLRYENVAWFDSGAVKILDRRIYPRKVEFVTCHTYQEVAKAIADMVTQSAGPYTAAGMGMALAAYQCRDKGQQEQEDFLAEAGKVIANARPTTANRMRGIVEGCKRVALEALAKGNSAEEAISDHMFRNLERRYATMTKVGEYLVDLFPKKGRIMTQCFGETIVGTMLREAKNRNLKIALYCPETRPYLQGARLTATVASEMGYEVTVITDNMAALVMEQKQIDLLTSAADTICLDGHIANKIGTFQLAIAAKHMGIPYFVSGIPDKDKQSKAEIKIEERDPVEVLMAGGIKHTADQVHGYYPSFDVTPPHLISGVVTDKGIYSPYDLPRYFATAVADFYDN